MSTPTPPSTPYASASLYVGDLAPEVTEALLFEIFSGIGAVASVRVCRDAATRRSLGYAYVNFHRVEDAERALDTMNFSLIRLKPCRIMWSHRDPSLRKSGLGNIFVKNLAKSIDNKSLFDTFSVFGNILSCKVATNSKRESLGYGFVHYENDESAENAIRSVNNKIISGEIVQVATFKSKKDRGGADKSRFTNVYVKNLPEDYKKEALEKLFCAFGKITSAHLAEEKDGKCKGFGFVNFEQPAEAQKAVSELDGKTKLTDKPLVVCRAQKKEEREKELREKFEHAKIERQKKYAGVNLYIKNLSDSIDDDRLNHEFNKFGLIKSGRVMKDSSDKSRGFGFVCFSTPEEATKAVTEMNGHMLEGKPLYVALAQRKEVRRAQLEAYHAQRAKMQNVPQPTMFPPQGTPLYPYLPQMQNQHYYPQMVRRTNFPSQPQSMMNVRVPSQQYGLMPINGGGGVNNQQQRTQPPNQSTRGRARGRGTSGGGPKNNGQLQNQLHQQQGGSGGSGSGSGGQNPRRGGGGGSGSGSGGGGSGNNYKFTSNARNQSSLPQSQYPPQQMAVSGGGGGGNVHIQTPQQQQQLQQQPQQQPQQQQQHSMGSHVEEGTTPENAQSLKGLTTALATASEDQRKQMLGEKLFPLIAHQQPNLAGKITGMLLEMDNTELLHLLESDSALQAKISEALTVLQNASNDDSNDGGGGEGDNDDDGDQDDSEKANS